MQLLIQELDNPYLQENFRRIQEFVRLEKVLAGKFQIFEITIPSAVTNLRYKHHLGFLPKDIVQTSLTGTGTLTWNYDRFDRDFLDITTTGSCTVRALIGRIEETSNA
jgi:hypothetical protein